MIPEKVTVKMKIVYESKDGAVALEAKRTQAQWGVVLDKRMEKEANFCAEQLDCNVIVVKNSETKVLRLNLIEPRKPEPEVLFRFSNSTKQRFKNDFKPVK